MSVVTNVILLPGFQSGTPEQEARLEAALLAPLECAGGQQFKPLDVNWGGDKYPECDVYAAAFKYLHASWFARWLVGEVPWIDRSAVRVLVCEQEDDAFSLYLIGDRDLVPVDVHAALHPERYRSTADAGAP